MKTALRIACILSVGIGVVWIFQGIGMLPGSFMTGDMTWTWIGAAAVAVGVAGLAAIHRRR